MIYDFTILNSRGEHKQFYITADDDKSFYRRIFDTYGALPEQVNIRKLYKETEDYYYKEVTKKKVDKNLDKATEAYNKASKKRGKKKEEYIKKYNFSETKITSINDVSSLMEVYKKVKVYWQPGKKRGTKEYYALVK